MLVNNYGTKWLYSLTFILLSFPLYGQYSQEWDSTFSTASREIKIATDTSGKAVLFSQTEEQFNSIVMIRLQADGVAFQQDTLFIGLRRAVKNAFCLNDNTLLLASDCQSSDSLGGVFLTRVDQQGNTIWEKNWPRDSARIIRNVVRDPASNTIMVMNSGTVSDAAHFASISPTGQVNWERQYPEMRNASSISIRLSPGGIIGLYFIKTGVGGPRPEIFFHDPAGTILWQYEASYGTAYNMVCFDNLDSAYIQFGVSNKNHLFKIDINLFDFWQFSYGDSVGRNLTRQDWIPLPNQDFIRAGNWREWGAWRGITVLRIHKDQTIVSQFEMEFPPELR